MGTDFVALLAQLTRAAEAVGVAIAQGDDKGIIYLNGAEEANRRLIDAMQKLCNHSFVLQQDTSSSLWPADARKSFDRFAAACIAVGKWRYLRDAYPKDESYQIEFNSAASQAWRARKELIIEMFPMYGYIAYRTMKEGQKNNR